MNTKLPFFLLLTLSTVLLCLSSSALALTIAYPPTNSYIEHEGVNLILQIDNDSVDSVTVTVNTYQYPPLNVPSGKETLCFGILLATNMNTIQVDGFKNDKKTSSQELEIFVRSALDNKSKKASKRMPRYLFHVPENEKQCVSCHTVKPDLSDMTPTEPSESSCYSCHKNKIDGTHLHSPSKKWDCLQCHETKSGNRKYEVPKPLDKVCYRCHGEKITQWKKMKSMHGPTAVGQCSVCHDPHGSDWQSLTRMHTSDLCNMCHLKKASGKHVIAGFFGKGHPTRGVPHPNEKGKEFTCAGCHSPHASDFKALLKMDNSKMGIYCNTCHKK